MKFIRYWITLPFLLVPVLAWSAPPLDGVWREIPGSYQTSVRIAFTIRHGMYECISACGIQGKGGYRMPADGKFHAVAGSNHFDQLAVRVVDARTLRIRRKENGRLVRAATFTLAPDGKHARVDVTVHQHGRDSSMHSRLARVSPGPADSHALSGVWRLQTAMGSTSWSYTIHTRGRALTFTDSTGPNYRTTVGGSPSTVHDDIPDETVSVRRLGPRTWRETFRQHGKRLGTRTITISGKGERHFAVPVNRTINARLPVAGEIGAT